MGGRPARRHWLRALALLLLATAIVPGVARFY